MYLSVFCIVLWYVIVGKKHKILEKSCTEDDYGEQKWEQNQVKDKKRVTENEL